MSAFPSSYGFLSGHFLQQSSSVQKPTNLLQTIDAELANSDFGLQPSLTDTALPGYRPSLVAHFLFYTGETGFTSDSPRATAAPAGSFGFNRKNGTINTRLWYPANRLR